MTQDEIIRHIQKAHPGVEAWQPQPGDEPAIAVGDTFFLYDPDGSLPPEKKLPFATIVTKDYGEFDNLSQLDREGMFRLNIGVSRETYHKLFGVPPGPVSAADYDYAALDTLIPHPVYAPQAWVSVNNPGEISARQVVALIDEAYHRAVGRYRG